MLQRQVYNQILRHCTSLRIFMMRASGEGDKLPTRVLQRKYARLITKNDRLVVVDRCRILSDHAHEPSDKKHVSGPFSLMLNCPQSDGLTALCNSVILRAESTFVDCVGREWMPLLHQFGKVPRSSQCSAPDCLRPHCADGGVETQRILLKWGHLLNI